MISAYRTTCRDVKIRGQRKLDKRELSECGKACREVIEMCGGTCHYDCSFGSFQDQVSWLGGPVRSWLLLGQPSLAG